jgi:hypothetical protein
MPRRTNTFQQVVAILHEHMAGSAAVEESAMLKNKETGEEREVDVVIRSTVAGQELILGVEATTGYGGSPWVEQMIGKHADLPTDRLVLVSEKGFSGLARRSAKAKRIALITSEDLAVPHPAVRIVGRLERVWPKGLSLTPTEMKVVVEKPDGTLQRVREVPPDAQIYLADGRAMESPTGNPIELLKWLVENEFPRLAEMIRLGDIEEDRDEFFVLQLGDQENPWLLMRDGFVPVPLYLRWEATAEPELHRIQVMEYIGRAVINVTEVRLTHRRFDTSLVAYGEAPIGGKDALFVITEDENGPKMSIRTGPISPTPASDDREVKAKYDASSDHG